MDISNSTHSFIKRIRSRLIFDPMRDWFVLLTISILTFVGLVVWNVWAFDTVAQGGIIGTTATTTKSGVNRSSIDAVHALFERRATEEAKYTTGVYRYANPSQ